MSKSSPYYEGARKEVAKFLPEQYSRVLEVGCGEGGFHINLKQGCEHWGIEPVHPAADIARRKLHRVIEASYLEALNQLPDNYYDLVICNDVIEHMVDHDEFFRTIRRKISEKACLVGSIPNVRYIGNLFELLFLKDWKYKDDGILDRTHLRFFTDKSIKRSFCENGFMIEEYAGINGVELGFMPLRIMLKNACILLFGSDTRFLQFGFRIRSIGTVSK
jgi:SAM-dependent methyltransferase